MTALYRALTLLLLTCCLSYSSEAQRVYKTSSVLATGSWYKISVSNEGIYKIDLSLLTSLGISGPIPSAQIRLFGKTGAMLPEDLSRLYIDDLEEIALSVVDGGDGTLNGPDYVIFYSKGPHQWTTDIANRRFRHQKNLFSDQVYYFLTIGGTGKRVQLQPPGQTSSVTVNSFDERYYHELDSVNFLSSGKEWYGEEFSQMPGRSLSRQFNIPASNVVINQPVTLVSSLVSRSVGANSRFDILINNQLVMQSPIPAISGGILDLFAQQVTSESTTPLNQPSLGLTFNYTPGGFNAQGWLNWFELHYRRELKLTPNQQLAFRDWSSVGSNGVEFKIQNASAGIEVWEVSDPFTPVKMNVSIIGSEASFRNDASVIREYISTTGTFQIPQALGRIENQNLHNSTESDYVIVSHPDFLNQAQRLAAFHTQRNNLRVVVVTTTQVFNEFAAGTPDPTAIRDFAKMYYDKYRSAWNDRKYLLLFGKGSFDYKNRINGNTNFVPVYETVSSLDPLGTYTSDDFFGFLDDHENINAGLVLNLLDIGIGRIPVKNADEAKNFVDKIESYHSKSSFGPWRNNMDFIADDEDFNLHLQDAEVLTATAKATAPVFNYHKIYLDAFRQESSSAGARFPQANAVINNNIYNGTLLWNYSGHGGALRLAEEVVLDQSIVNKWNNENKLPLFVTATCDFAPYDHPLVNSLGENLLVRPKTGAIALMTTSRVVFAYSNRIINNNYLQLALAQDSNGEYKTLGEAVKATKNFTYQNSGDLINNRKFVLLGDPAMSLGFPQFKTEVKSINGQDIALITDTLSAGELVSIEGEVTDHSGTLLTDFNGVAYITVYDKPSTIRTLANDPTSQPVDFQTQTSSLFRGKASATAGKFSFRFRLPKDINYQFGNGKMSLYAHDDVKDANGLTTNFIVGGIGTGGITDNEGPVIKAYLNDDRFVNGSITNETPVLIVKLTDSSGINTGNAGIDHDIIATLDNDNRKYFILNDFYESELDSYQSGTVRFQLPELEPGQHTLHIKAWDVMNNSSEYILEFTVHNDGDLVLDHVLNYPNPFTTKTSFWFEHNRPGEDLHTRVEIFTITGKIIKTLTRTINTDGNRSNELEWDGIDEYGDKIGRGVYLYRLTVQTVDGKKATQIQRLVVIR